MEFQPQQELKLSNDDEINYQRYKEIWLGRKLIHPNNFVDWSISNNIGDPFNREEWYIRDHLHDL